MVSASSQPETGKARSERERQDLENVLEQLDEVADGSREVSVADLQEAFGRRGFAPFLLVGGLIVLSPVGGIPGVPTIFGIVVLLTAGQLLIGRRSFWLPGAVADRAIDAGKLRAASARMKGAAHTIDRFLRPRLTVLTDGIAAYGVALACVVLALTLPALEAVPFGAAAPAAAITIFALALVAHDGALAALGYAATAGSIWVVATNLPF